MLNGDLKAQGIENFFAANIATAAMTDKGKKKGCLEYGDGSQCKKAAVSLTRWKELQQTGYLLGSAYRTKPTEAPEKVRQVQEVRSFITKVETLEKALKKGDKNASKTSYIAAKEALEIYLKDVDIKMAAGNKKKTA